MIILIRQHTTPKQHAKIQHTSHTAHKEEANIT